MVAITKRFFFTLREKEKEYISPREQTKKCSDRRISTRIINKLTGFDYQQPDVLYWTPPVPIYSPLDKFFKVPIYNKVPLSSSANIKYTTVGYNYFHFGSDNQCVRQMIIRARADQPPRCLLRFRPDELAQMVKVDCKDLMKQRKLLINQENFEGVWDTLNKSIIHVPSQLFGHNALFKSVSLPSSPVINQRRMEFGMSVRQSKAQSLT